MTTTFLLDVNVLIALVDPAHMQHDAAHEWFAVQGHHAWATCPLTENGVLRIVGNTRYPNSPGTPAAVAPLLATLRALPVHVFRPDDISLVDAERVDAARLLARHKSPAPTCWRWLAPMAVSWRASTGAWSRMRCAVAHGACS